MRHTSSPRNFALTVFLLGLSTALIVFLTACGGSTSAASPTTSSATPSTGATDPPTSSGSAGSGTTGSGSAGSGTSGTPSDGGTSGTPSSGTGSGQSGAGGSDGSGNTGGSGNSGKPSAAGNRYLYVGIVQDLGGLDGFAINPYSGKFTEVPGAPILFGSAQDAYSQAGPIAAVNGFVYVGYGPPNLAAPVIRAYAVDPSTGALGTYTDVDAGAQNGDEQMTALVTDPAGHNLYVVYQRDIASFQINTDGSLSYLGTATYLATAFIGGLTISPAGELAFVMADNCPPKGDTCTGPPDFLALDRDPNSGALSSTGKLMGQNDVADVSGYMSTAFDNTGKYFVAWTVNQTTYASQITVYSVDYVHDALTPVGSYSTINSGTVTSLTPSLFAFDKSNSLLYVLESSALNEKPEALVVYGFNQSTGALQQVQAEGLPSGSNAAGLNVDSNFVYVVDSRSGTGASAIYELKRKPNGTVHKPVLVHKDTARGLGSAAELQF